MKIAVFEVEEWEREAFAGHAERHDMEMRREPLDQQNARLYAGSP